MKPYPNIVQFRTDDGILHDFPPTEPKKDERGPAYHTVVHDQKAYDRLMKRLGGSIIGGAKAEEGDV